MSPGEFNVDDKYLGVTQNEPLTEDLKEELKTDGYFISNSRVHLGAGEATFLRAKKSLESWRHFQLGWTSVDPSTPVKLKQQFIVRVNELLLVWLLQPLEIKYVHDSYTSQGLSQQGPCSTILKDNKKGVFAFGSGLLKGHLLVGEERFSVKWEEDDSVWYEILSFSKPAAFLSMATYPYVQWKQRLFAKHSSSAMVKAVSDSSS
ncbi:hypothetical protein GOP47_0007436 [Adiantum capillus-veneris]|uniref:DUF1990 domain-containing protein n=1 Tax=Adiantum capillus-veneris TaxID=13818 RepID=A0A9D4V1I6_ADICA|nr:hypothetical protein GOP47_0007436 [Adiantum capillus-veneris]